MSHVELQTYNLDHWELKLVLILVLYAQTYESRTSMELWGVL